MLAFLECRRGTLVDRLRLGARMCVSFHLMMAESVVTTALPRPASRYEDHQRRWRETESYKDGACCRRTRQTS
jgi:hypothetical protein